MSMLPNVRPRVEVAPTAILAFEDTAFANAMGVIVQRLGWSAHVVHDGEAALQLALARRPVAILADLRMPRRSGVELCSVLRRDPELAEVPIVLMATAHTEAERVEVLSAGGDELLVRPLATEPLIALLRRLVARASDAERHRRRATDLERDLSRLEADARRARETAVHEHDLRTLVAGVADGLLRTVDLEALDDHVRRAVLDQVDHARLEDAPALALLALDVTEQRQAEAHSLSTSPESSLIFTCMAALDWLTLSPVTESLLSRSAIRRFAWARSASSRTVCW